MRPATPWPHMRQGVSSARGTQVASSWREGTATAPHSPLPRARRTAGNGEHVTLSLLPCASSPHTRTSSAARHQAGFSQKASTLLPSGSRTKAA
jgi:hypothetical protein